MFARVFEASGKGPGGLVVVISAEGVGASTRAALVLGNAGAGAQEARLRALARVRGRAKQKPVNGNLRFDGVT